MRLQKLGIGEDMTRTISTGRIKVGIVGGTGYTGVELLRLLSMHPSVELNLITSRSEAGKPVAELYPSLRGFIDLTFSEPETDSLACCDIVFFATPNGIAMHQVPELLDKKVKIIDLSADFRLKDPAVWEQWYSEPHACPSFLDEAVYGLPEMNRDLIKAARLVANPGCYPTSVQLALYPLLMAGAAKHDGVIADVKSGVSGAGRGAKIGSLLCEASESIKAYGVDGHRHHPELIQQLSLMAKQPVNLTFVPHLVPMIRGIHATIYVDINDELETKVLRSLYNEMYAEEPFVDLMAEGSHPATKMVFGSNLCKLSIFRISKNKAVILSVIDNLVKGAAGQAVQNMNLMFGLPEKEGLGLCPVVP